MGVNESYVHYVSSEWTQTGRVRARLSRTRRQLTVYSVTATTAVVVPLVHYSVETSANELYIELTSHLNSALTNSTVFVDHLTAASTANGATNTMNVESVSAVVSVASVIYPPTNTPSSAPVLITTSEEEDDGDANQGGFSTYNVIVIAVCVAVLLSVAMCYCTYIRRKSMTQSETKMRTPRSTVTYHNHLAAPKREVFHEERVDFFEVDETPSKKTPSDKKKAARDESNNSATNPVQGAVKNTPPAFKMLETPPAVQKVRPKTAPVRKERVIPIAPPRLARRGSDLDMDDIYRGVGADNFQHV
jgi:flagellar basal body-associated protein FliL